MPRTALITGSSRGIGKAIALRLAQNGHHVVVNYKQNQTEAEAVVEQIRAHSGTAIALQADIAIADDCTRLVDQTISTFGGIDILINNAGILRRGDLFDFDFSQMDGMRHVNVDGLVRVSRAAAAVMKQNQWGRIVNLTSIAAIGTAMAGTTFYAATKAAVIALTRRFALDLGPYGITVNAIAPGFILTDMARQTIPPDQYQAVIDSISARAMMRRVGTPDDIAAAVSFLTSEDAAFLTAQVLTIDGGRMDYIAHP